MKIDIESTWSRRSNGSGGGASKRCLLSPCVKVVNLSNLVSGTPALPDGLEVLEDALLIGFAPGVLTAFSISLVLLAGFGDF